MSGAGDLKGHAVTSWGWADSDGQGTLRGNATHRLWKVSGGRGFVLLPVDQGAEDALLVACAGFWWKDAEPPSVSEDV